MSNLSAREKLIASLFDLLEKTDFENIKVSNIVDKSGVSRQTFYRLFRDKEELAKEACFYHFDRFLYCNCSSPSATYKDMVLCLMDAMLNKRKAFKHLLADLKHVSILAESFAQIEISRTGSSDDMPTLITSAFNWKELILDKNPQGSLEELYMEARKYTPLAKFFSNDQINTLINDYESKTVNDFIKNKE